MSENASLGALVASTSEAKMADLSGKSSAFLNAYARAAGKPIAMVRGPATRTGGPGAPHGAPVSPQYLRGQHERQTHTAISEWHDHTSGTARYVETPQGPISAESDPLGYLRAHGLAAIDADGDEVMPSPGQARGLVGAYLDTMQRNALSSQKGSTTVSFRDPQMRGGAALVRARRIV